MVVRVVLFVLMAMALIGFGTVAYVSLGPGPQKVVKGPPQVAVLVTARPVRAGSLLQPTDIGMKLYVKSEVPKHAQLDTPVNRTLLVGAMIRRSLPVGSPLLPSIIIRPGDRGFLAAVLGPGMRAVSVGVDAVSGTAGLIWPGDRVDLILTESLNGKGEPIGHQVVAETVLSAVRVIAIDQKLVEGAVPGNKNGALARTVTLEVTPREAEQVTVAQRLGQLSLVVHSSQHSPNRLAAGNPGLVWGSDVSPALAARAGAAAAAGAAANGGSVRVFQGAQAQEFKF